MEANNIDALLAQDNSTRMNPQAEPVPVVETVTEAPIESDDSSTSGAEPKTAAEAPQEQVDVPRGTSDKPAEKKEAAAESPIDDYGNPIAKPKTYTEDEVNAMFQERLARGRMKDQQQPQQPAQPNQSQAQPERKDYETQDEWQRELDAYIDRRVDRREQEARKRQEEIEKAQWQQKMQEDQAAFEQKFTSGMQKYSDFNSVVENKQISPAFMVATKNLGNPAGFVYAACKLFPKEVERISQLPDSSSVMFEVGKLHERMIKTKGTESKAARPLEPNKGDMPAKAHNELSIDQRIIQHAKGKRQR